MRVIDKSELALHGGSPVRRKPLPYRRLFDREEISQVMAVFQDSWERRQDFGFQGSFEEEYTKAFADYQGGGYADGVCSGTAALYIALRALELEAGSEVILSPVTDPGCVSPVIMQGFRPVIADAEPGGFNVGPEQFESAISAHTRAAVLTHLGGLPIDIEPIVQLAEEHNIALVEDCSQAHGAEVRGRKVGCWGRMAAFSTGFPKNHATGGCGGVVYTRGEQLYWRARAHADRGKSFNEKRFDPKNPDTFLGPGLNLNLDELSAAIGTSTLKKLNPTIRRRAAIVDQINKGLAASAILHPLKPALNTRPSYFFHTVSVDSSALQVDKNRFAKAVQAEGIGINPDYRYMLSEWTWLVPYLRAGSTTPNAAAFRNESFNILFHERFTDEDIEDVIKAILKVEGAFRR